MGLEIRYVCLVETRRLLLLMGVVFGLILFVQHFELPYGLSSVSLQNKPQPAPVDKFPVGNFADWSSSHEVPTTVKASDERVSDSSDVKDDFGRGNNRTVNDTINDDMDPEESVFDDSVERDHKLKSEEGVRNTEFRPAKTRENGGVPSLSPSMNSSTVISSRINNDGILKNNEKPELVKADSTELVRAPSNSNNPVAKKRSEQPVPSTRTISEMNDMLLKSRMSYSAAKPRWSSPVDQVLLNVQSLIENASIIEKDPQFDVRLYRNFSAFKRSYELMEQTLKVYTYAEGNRPIFHQPPLKGIYASEGWFMKQLKGNKQFITKNARRAHLFYLPFSSRELELALYVPNSHNRKLLLKTLSDYIETISTKYNFWNRTGGSDHFLVACHDWAPSETMQTMPNCIRSLCNSDIQEGFQFGKDASLPETYVRSPQNPLRQLGGLPPSKRRILAFFAGNMHGYVRPILLKHWENKDPDMKIFGRLRRARGQMTYAQYMKSSKYCICAKGYEVNSPRVVEAIFYECIPVIISDNFVPPFFETLNWESFAVFVLEKDIPNLKSILSSIPRRKYLEMQRRVRQVQQHFLWHSKPVKYDVFHMILHSIWYNRVFQTRPW